MPFNDTRGFVLSAACALVLALSGCGGGGSSTGTTPPSGRSMAQLESEPVALPEGVTLATAGTFTVEPGRSVDRDGARFTCAAGGAACTVVVAERAGGGFVATVTGGRVMVAAVAPGGGGQNGEMGETDWPLPDWPVADVDTTRSLMGGSTLSWSSSEIEGRIVAFGESGVASHHGGSRGVSAASWCVDRSSQIHQRVCNVEYRSVMTYRSIPIVQARALHSAVGVVGDDGRPGEEIAIGGILEHGYFMVSRGRINIGRDSENEEIGSDHYIAFHDDSTSVVSTGRWRGVLVGTGRNATSPLYRQFIMGDVDVTVELGTSRFRGTVWRDIDVDFSNIRNIDTGATVTLSRMRWEFDNQCCKGAGIGLNTGLEIDFRGPNDEEAFGVFEVEEAFGAFGAKKQ